MKQQKGFSVIEILVALAILAILVGGAWVWTQAEQRTNPQSTPALTSTTGVLPTVSPLLTAQLSPTPNLIADWKTYTDPVYNFSLKYPPAWQVTKGNQHAPSIPSEMTEMINLQSRTGVFDLSIIPWHNNLKKDLEEELSSFITGYLGDFDVSYENTQLDKDTALRGSYLQSAMGPQVKIIITAIEKGDDVFFFQTQFETGDTARFALYNQILSTFKFFDVLSPTREPTAHWKTYTNNKYKYSLEYPSDFFYGYGQTNLPAESHVIFDPTQGVVQRATLLDNKAFEITVKEEVVNPLVEKTYLGLPATVTEKSITIDNQTATQFIFTEPVKQIQTATVYNNKTYYLNLYKMEFETEYNQILSTFKFLD